MSLSEILIYELHNQIEEGIPFHNIITFINTYLINNDNNILIVLCTQFPFLSLIYSNYGYNCMKYIYQMCPQLANIKLNENHPIYIIEDLDTCFRCIDEIYKRNFNLLFTDDYKSPLQYYVNEDFNTFLYHLHKYKITPDELNFENIQFVWKNKL